MNVTYHIRLMYENRYQVTFEIPTLSGRTMLTSSTRCDARNLNDLLRQATTVISGCISQRKKWDKELVGASQLRYVWDGDATDLPSPLQKQAEEFRRPGLQLLAREVLDAPKPRTPRLLEVIKKNGVWTIVKHEKELMTWEQACAELAKRI